jgi:hypothetical protein
MVVTMVVQKVALRVENLVVMMVVQWVVMLDM